GVVRPRGARPAGACVAALCRSGDLGVLRGAAAQAMSRSMMLRTPLALLGLPLLGLGCQPEPSVAATAATVAPAPAPASAQASKAPLVRPATLPAVPAEPPPPTAPP